MLLVHPVALAQMAIFVGALGLGFHPWAICSAETRPGAVQLSTTSTVHGHVGHAPARWTEATIRRMVHHAHPSRLTRRVTTSSTADGKTDGPGSVLLASGQKPGVATSGMQQVRALGSPLLASGRLPGIAGIGRQVHVGSSTPRTQTVSGIVMLDSIASVTVLTAHGSQTIKLTSGTRYLSKGKTSSTKPALHAGEKAVISAIQVKGILVGQIVSVK